MHQKEGILYLLFVVLLLGIFIFGGCNEGDTIEYGAIYEREYCNVVCELDNPIFSEETRYKGEIGIANWCSKDDDGNQVCNAVQLLFYNYNGDDHVLLNKGGDLSVDVLYWHLGGGEITVGGGSEDKRIYADSIIRRATHPEYDYIEDLGHTRNEADYEGFVNTDPNEQTIGFEYYFDATFPCDSASARIKAECDTDTGDKDTYTACWPSEGDSHYMTTDSSGDCDTVEYDEEDCDDLSSEVNAIVNEYCGYVEAITGETLCP